MIKGKLVAIDLAKSIFQVAIFSARTKRPISNKSLSRTQLNTFLQQLPPCTIALEACGGAHYWRGVAKSYGHRVMLLSAQFVKAFRQGHKTDANDALAIGAAAQAPHVREVPGKEPDRLALQGVLRIRSSYITDRTAVSNQLRGILAEFGIVMPKGFATLKKQLPTLLADENSMIHPLQREPLRLLLEHFYTLHQRILTMDSLLRQAVNALPVCQELQKIKGVGLISASELYVALGDGTVFASARAAAAYVGTSPKQYSSGGKVTMIGIGRSAQGSLRSTLITGALAYVTRAIRSDKPEDQWIRQQYDKKRSHKHAAVAWANKVVRTAWAMIRYDRPYDLAFEQTR